MIKKLSLLTLTIAAFGAQDFTLEKSQQLGRGYAKNISVKIEGYEELESSKSCEKVILNDFVVSKEQNTELKKRTLFYSDYIGSKPYNEEFAVNVFKECVLTLDELKTIKAKYVSR